ncbi:MAG: hypothetical protein AB9835_07305 [Eubacteriales bacterium]
MTYYGISGAARAAGSKAAGRVASREGVKRVPVKITPAVPSTARVNGRAVARNTSAGVRTAGAQVKRSAAGTASITGTRAGISGTKTKVASGTASVSADTAKRRAVGTAKSAAAAVGTRTGSIAGVRSNVLPKARTRIKYIDTAVKAAPMPVHIICGAIMITLLFLFFVYNCVQLNEYNSKTVQLKKQINDYTQEYVSLENQLSQREDMASIEQKAISIGMIKKDLLPRKYVSVIDGDKIEVIKDSSEQSGISTLLSGISKSILNIQEYLKG